MSRREFKARKRQTVCAVESLDERLLLSTIPPTPAPAPSPVSVARLEHRIERMDRVFMTGARHMNRIVTNRAVQLEATLQATASRAQAQVQAAMVAAASSSGSSTATHAQTATNRLATLAATTAASVNRLASAVQHQLGALTASMTQASARFGVPVRAVENNLRAARASFTTSVSNALNSVTTQVQSASTAVANQVATTANTELVNEYRNDRVRVDDNLDDRSHVNSNIQ